MRISHDKSTMIYVALCVLLCPGTVTPDEVSWRVQQHWKNEERLHRAMKSHVMHEDNYIHLLQRRLTKLMSARSVVVGKQDHLSSPLSALVTIRRLSEDWTSLAFMVKQHNGSHLKNVWNMRWPNDRDVIAAARAVMRTQLTYNLSIDFLAQGYFLEDFQTNVSAADCSRIATVYYKSRYFAEAVRWYQQALSKINGGDSSIPRQMALQHLMLSLCSSGKAKEFKENALEFIRKYANKTPRSSDFEYNNFIILDCSEYENEEMGEYDIPKYALGIQYSLCQTYIKVESRLQCRYVDYQQPHLRFQPFKLEELKLDPPVLRFLDVITDLEVETLKRENKMEPARIVSIEDGSEVSTDYRASFAAYIYNGQSAVGDRLSRRIGDMTRLDVRYAEPHQLTSYALAGSVMPHKDFGAPLSDVEQGGNTVFLTWGLSVPPVKNSAILWFNFLPNGDFNHQSDHGACPVLKGRKWVLNKWISNLAGMQCTVNSSGSFKDFYV